jgi:hypothetical protein
MNLSRYSKIKYTWCIFLLLFISIAKAQAPKWQQRVNYVMDIDFDVNKHQFNGKQKLEYWNNSPDTLQKVFYHLYYNAFQPGSMMDIRSRTIKDPDPRVMDRIEKLKENEIGYHKIKSLKRDGKSQDFKVEETILEVTLDKPVLPGSKTTFEMEFDSQVPVQIRRTGRNNKEGIDYSMTQWYPKIAEYDHDGWHSNPYVAREFHGVWGDFEVKISIDSTYTIGGTGYLQNPQEIGHGYQDRAKPLKRGNNKKLTWHFKAPLVHDFAWAADRDYAHDVVEVPEGPTLHFFYDKDTLADNWKRMEPLAVKSFQIANAKFGKYPYKQYSIIQGGDGGMEYPMATLITSHESFSGLVSVTIHESLHSWYQGVLATNESKYPWMDEGFTTFAQYYIMDSIYNYKQKNPHSRSYNGYFSLVKAGIQEPLSTHSDFYNLNSAYSTSSYSKGAVFLHQLSYIIGKDAFWKGMKRYYEEWKFKHPTPTDFKRVMEKTSGIELDWYLEQWVETTNTIDYGIKSVSGDVDGTTVTLEKTGRMPMPVDINVSFKDGSQQTFYIPLQLMRGEKKEAESGKRIVLSDWPWAYPEYTFTIPAQLKNISHIEIDSSQRMADVDRNNNIFPYPDNYKFFGRKVE